MLKQVMKSGWYEYILSPSSSVNEFLANDFWVSCNKSFLSCLSVILIRPKVRHLKPKLLYRYIVALLTPNFNILLLLNKCAIYA